MKSPQLHLQYNSLLCCPGGSARYIHTGSSRRNATKQNNLPVSERTEVTVHPLQLMWRNSSHLDSPSVLMGVKTGLNFVAGSLEVPSGPSVADVQGHSCPPQHRNDTHTLNPKALQGSDSSQAKNPSWGNPQGSSTVPPALPLKSYWVRKSREQLGEGGGACFVHSAVRCKGRNSDTTRCKIPAEIIQLWGHIYSTHAHCTTPSSPWGLAAQHMCLTLLCKCISHIREVWETFSFI